MRNCPSAPSGRTTEKYSGAGRRDVLADLHLDGGPYVVGDFGDAPEPAIDPVVFKVDDLADGHPVVVAVDGD